MESIRHAFFEIQVINLGKWSTSMKNRLVKIGALAVIVFIVVFALLTFNRVKTDKRRELKLSREFRKLKKLRLFRLVMLRTLWKV